MTADFAPSQVVLVEPLPLIGTMGRCEREIAAALLVRACQFYGDRWQAIVPKMIGDVLTADMEAKTQPFASLSSNPFARPDFHDLIAEGYATGEPATKGAPLELTEKAFDAMRRWVRAPSGDVR